MSSEFIDPLGRTFFEQPRPEGGLYLEPAPGQRVCDFCMTPNPAWEYPCGIVAIVGNPNITASDDEWAACDACHASIEAGNILKMVAGMVRRQNQQPLHPAFRSPPLKQQHAIQNANVRAFLAARTGPARPIQ